MRSRLPKRSNSLHVFVLTTVALVFLFASAAPALGAYVVGTLAGPAVASGDADGVGSAARFDWPQGVAVDSAGNLYVADSFNHTIRRITPAGAVTTFAGTAGAAGSADGAGSAARFAYPSAIAIDSADKLYVADSGNHTIRVISPAGVVQTLAGLAGARGSADGASGVARFDFPEGVAVDAAGVVYVSDSGNHTIRVIALGGAVSTLAGAAGQAGNADGTGAVARFDHPFGIAVDAAGTLYVADHGNHTIRTVDPAGVVVTFAGAAGAAGGADGTGAAARFSMPKGLAIDGAGDLLVADFGNHTVRSVTSGAVVTTVAGKAGSWGAADGDSATARLLFPGGVAVDTGGAVYVADSGNHAVRKVAVGGAVTTLAGKSGMGTNDGRGPQARFFLPYGIAVGSSGTVFVADTYNHTLRSVSSLGVVTTLAGSGGIEGSSDGSGAAARFDHPTGVAVNDTGTLFVADTGNHVIRVVSSLGAVGTPFGTAGLAGSADGLGPDARFSGPKAVALDDGGTIYVADTANHTIRAIDPTGAVTTVAGKAGEPGNADGAASDARFRSPSGIAVDWTGTLYVADTGNHTIRMISPTGVVTSLAGAPGVRGAANGLGSSARFSAPAGIALGAEDALFVADSGNSTVRRVSHMGAVTTVAGLSRTTGRADGVGSAARFALPSDVAVGPDDFLYVADTFNHIIRKIDPPPIYAVFTGKDRYETAILVAKSVYPTGANTVFLVKGDNFPDALAAAPLAAAFDGPIILTPSTGLTQAVRDELARLAPSTVFFIGLPAAVRTQLNTALPGVKVRSFVGTDRYHTAALLAAELKVKLGTVDRVVLASGDKFPDALSVAPLAARKGWAVVLTPQSGPLPVVTAAAIQSLGVTSAVVVGTYIKPAAPVTATSLVGTDRYHTNALIAAYAAAPAQGLSFSHIAVATGENYPDALVVGPYLAMDGGILLLTQPTGVPTRIADVLTGRAAEIRFVDFVGLGDAIIAQLKAKVEPVAGP
ncbi:MAG: cell wall-binding repeat-containing protein [Actinobacteria bacterium]|nr:cell wall-binding repeat-containing protein [Actinomycetota bacterium]